MLHDLWSGDLTILGDVADDDHRDIGMLRKSHQRRGTLPHLCETAGRRVTAGGSHRLDGVDDQQVGAGGLSGLNDRLDVRLRVEEASGDRRGVGDTLRPDAYLPHTLLPADVERGDVEISQHALQDEGALADARLTAHQDEGALDETSAEDAIELTVTHVHPRSALGRDLTERHWSVSSLRAITSDLHPREIIPDAKLLETIPLPTGGTAPQPLGEVLAAVAADVDHLVLTSTHRSSLDAELLVVLDALGEPLTDILGIGTEEGEYPSKLCSRIVDAADDGEKEPL